MSIIMNSVKKYKLVTNLQKEESKLTHAKNNKNTHYDKEIGNKTTIR